MRVGNQVGGIDEMPDYDREALEIRERVEIRLPDPLPSEAVACADMLDGVRAYYVDTQGPESEAVAILEKTHDADLAACREKTTVAAALCVKLLAEERWGEYPRMLDQCSRAFP